MLDTALNAKAQVNQFLELQSELPQFTEQDWYFLSQLHRVFSQFSELTLFVSEKQPQISMVIPLYYELHDMLKDGAEKKGIFTHLDDDIAAALHQGLVKYQKYSCWDRSQGGLLWSIRRRIRSNFLRQIE